MDAEFETTIREAVDRAYARGYRDGAANTYENLAPAFEGTEHEIANQIAEILRETAAKVKKVPA